jgi:hypothetical protein
MMTSNIAGTPSSQATMYLIMLLSLLNRVIEKQMGMRREQLYADVPGRLIGTVPILLSAHTDK